MRGNLLLSSAVTVPEEKSRVYECFGRCCPEAEGLNYGPSSPTRSGDPVYLIAPHVPETIAAWTPRRHNRILSCFFLPERSVLPSFVFRPQTTICASSSGLMTTLFLGFISGLHRITRKVPTKGDALLGNSDRQLLIVSRQRHFSVLLFYRFLLFSFCFSST